MWSAAASTYFPAQESKWVPAAAVQGADSGNTGDAGAVRGTRISQCTDGLIAAVHKVLMQLQPNWPDFIF